MKPDLDVLIIGAGPVGMTLACELVKHGLRIRIVDREAATKQYSRAPVLWPRAQEALDLMGIHHLWDGHTTPLRRMNVKVYGVPAGAVTLDACASARQVPLMVGQDVTEQILDAHLAVVGVHVERAITATTIAQDDDAVSVTLQSTGGTAEVVRAAWVIGCDGTHSFVRAGAGLAWEGRQLQGLMVPVSDAQADWPLTSNDGDAYVALTPKGYFLAIPMPKAWRVIVATPDTTPEGERPRASLEQVSRLAADAIGGPATLHDPEWVSVVRYGNFISPAFRQGRILLAGDAAHSIAPLSGQGMNVGIQDTVDLGWKLAYVQHGWAADCLLDSYTADRRPVANRLVRFTNRFFDAVLQPGTLQQALRRTVAPLALRVPSLRKKIAGFYTGTDIRYVDSPLNDSHVGKEPQPGQLARDGVLALWPGLTPLRFFDALRGRHWTLVLLSGRRYQPKTLNESIYRMEKSIAATGSQRLHGLVAIHGPTAQGVDLLKTVPIAVDAWGTFHATYGAAASSLVLIRPDGYVGLHRPADARGHSALEDYLARWFIPIRSA